MLKPVNEKLISSTFDDKNAYKFKNILENLTNVFHYKCVQRKSDKDVQYMIIGMSWFTKISKVEFIFNSSYFYIPIDIINFNNKINSLNNIINYVETNLSTHFIDIVVDISIKSISDDEVLLYQDYKSGVDIFTTKNVIQHNSYFTYIESNQ